MQDTEVHWCNFQCEDQGVCLWPPGQREQGRGVASNASGTHCRLSEELIIKYLIMRWQWCGKLGLRTTQAIHRISFPT